MKNFFELNGKYKFDPTDLTALIYVVAAIVGMCGGNTTPYFLVGSAIGTAFCWKARRINLIVLNVALFVFNIYCAFC
jgi:H+/Cl- antiporter ClcA